MASSSSSLFLSINPVFFSLHPKRRFFVASNVPSPYSPLLQRHNLRLQSSSQDTSNHSMEESRWLREEQRWFREEQRWLREEQRWARERDSLLKEIAKLRLQIQPLELETSIEVLKEKNLIAETGSSARSLILGKTTEEVVEEEEEEKAVVVEERVIRVLDEGKIGEKTKRDTRVLRVGAEGEEVKALQDALQKLGFYAGDEDTEFSSFSSGTLRAVKTWQSSIGVKEDGVMTTELLERLFLEQERENGAAAAAVTEVSKKVIKKTEAEVDVPEHKVFLLGENRWEDASRLTGKSKSSNSATKCLVCRGEGRLLCLECDGTGEPNVEPQFMEWVDEGANCPYCDGLGYTPCDVCDDDGKVIV